MAKLPLVLLFLAITTPISARTVDSVMEGAARGKPVTIGFIGGSITQGAWASKPEKRYVEQIATWWKGRFPNSKLKVVNAGIGGTASDYGVLRLDRDVLQHKPDIVVVEYGVNDAANPVAPESYKALLRQIRRNGAVAVALELGNSEGASAQNVHAPIAARLGVPLVSARDVIAERGGEGLFSDPVHPNDAGHALIASTFTDWLGSSSAPGIFENARIWEGEEFKPSEVRGWERNADGWSASKAGSRFTIDAEGSNFFLTFKARDTDAEIRVTIDGKTETLRARPDGPWFEQRLVFEIARGLEPGKHEIKVELVSDTNVPFVIYGIAAGR